MFLGFNGDYIIGDSGAAGFTLFSFYTNVSAIDAASASKIGRLVELHGNELRGRRETQAVWGYYRITDCSSNVLCIGVLNDFAYGFFTVLNVPCTLPPSQGGYRGTIAYNSRSQETRSCGWVSTNFVGFDGVPFVCAQYADADTWSSDVVFGWTPPQ